MAATVTDKPTDQPQQAKSSDVKAAQLEEQQQPQHPTKHQSSVSTPNLVTNGQTNLSDADVLMLPHRIASGIETKVARASYSSSSSCPTDVALCGDVDGGGGRNNSGNDGHIATHANDDDDDDNNNGGCKRNVSNGINHEYDGTTMVQPVNRLRRRSPGSNDDAYLSSPLWPMPPVSAYDEHRCAVNIPIEPVVAGPADVSHCAITFTSATFVLH